MPDGRRKRRNYGPRVKRQWYALHRAQRFQRRFGLIIPLPTLQVEETDAFAKALA